MNWVELAIGALAVWRFSSMLVRERGPWDLFLKLRRLAGIEHDENGEPVGYPQTFFGMLLECVWCTSMWTAILYVVLYAVFPWMVWAALPFALSALAILIDSAAYKG